MIRKASKADIPAIVAMSRKFYGTTKYAELAPMDYATVAELTELLIDAGIMLVVEQEQKLVGMVGLVLAPFMFNHNIKTAHEVVWWVDEAAHGLGIGKALLAAVEPACRDAGAKAIQMIHLATSPKAAAAIYRRMGYQESESCYTKEF